MSPNSEKSPETHFSVTGTRILSQPVCRYIHKRETLSQDPTSWGHNKGKLMILFIKMLAQIHIQHFCCWDGCLVKVWFSNRRAKWRREAKHRSYMQGKCECTLWGLCLVWRLYILYRRNYPLTFHYACRDSKRRSWKFINAAEHHISTGTVGIYTHRESRECDLISK